MSFIYTHPDYLIKLQSFGFSKMKITQSVRVCKTSTHVSEALPQGHVDEAAGLWHGLIDAENEEVTWDKKIIINKYIIVL